MSIHVASKRHLGEVALVEKRELKTHRAFPFTWSGVPQCLILWTVAQCCVQPHFPSSVLTGVSACLPFSIIGIRQLTHKPPGHFESTSVYLTVYLLNRIIDLFLGSFATLKPQQ